jgi:hypothetical protein
MTSPGPQGSDGIVLLQTSDPTAYAPFLRATARINRLFCLTNGVEYVAETGIRRGCHPWHATFNRIPIFLERLRAGFRGWLLYLDADAYVADPAFDIRGFLAARSHRAVVGALGHNKALSDLNAGVLFLNYAHRDTAFIVSEWHRLFTAEVSEAMLRGSPGGWSFRPNDQDLLQRVLGENLERLWEAIGVEPREVLNSREAAFVRQILRNDAADLPTRIALAEAEIDALLRQGRRAPLP